MSSNQTTPDTNENTSNDSTKRRRGRQPTTIKEAEAVAQVTVDQVLQQAQELVESNSRKGVKVEKAVPMRMSAEEYEKEMAMQREIAQLDTHVQICRSRGSEWLEVSKELLTKLCGGKYPEAHYMMYKDVRLCAPGTAEDIAKKESLTIEEILFVKNGETHVAQPK